MIFNFPCDRKINSTTPYLWYDGHSISIGTREVWRTKVGIQVSKKEFHTHIHLD